MEFINYTFILFSELNKESVSYCVLRNYELLPESTGGSDLDILIYKKDFIKFNAVLKKFIAENELNLVSVIFDEKCTKYCISKGSWGIQIDAFKESVYFGDKELIQSEYLFLNSFIHRGVKVLDPKIGALLAFLKEMLNNKICGKKYILSLQNQFPSDSFNERLLNQFDSKFASYFVKYLKELNADHCLELYKLSKKTYSKNILNGLGLKMSRFFQQPGYTLAFLGTDGSGKSTIIENIKIPLNEAFHNAVYYEHMRPNRFPSIAKLMGGKDDFSGPVTNPHGSKESGFFGSLFRWYYYLLDYTFGFYLKIWPKKAIRSCVWIFDRYYYDYLMDQKRARINLPIWMIRLGQFMIPEPDIILCLGADAAAIHKRKPELPLAEVERQVSELRRFCNSHKRAVWIDTGKSIDESTSDALEAIIKFMAKRFENVKIT